MEFLPSNLDRLMTGNKGTGQIPDKHPSDSLINEKVGSNKDEDTSQVDKNKFEHLDFTYDFGSVDKDFFTDSNSQPPKKESKSLITSDIFTEVDNMNNQCQKIFQTIKELLKKQDEVYLQIENYLEAVEEYCKADLQKVEEYYNQMEEELISLNPGAIFKPQ